MKPIMCPTALTRLAVVFLVIFLVGCGTRLTTPPEVYSKDSPAVERDSGKSAPDYDSDVSTWQEMPSPEDMTSLDAALWFYAANYSRHHWRVSRDGDRIEANFKNHSTSIGDCPSFNLSAVKFSDPEANILSGYRRCHPLPDGWLIGLNKGEFGGVLYWFDAKGEKSEKLSNDNNVEDIVELDGEVYVIEGLAHGGFNHGSIIKVTKDKVWKLKRVTILPEAPKAFAMLSGSSILLVLTDSIVVYSARKSPDGRVQDSLGWLRKQFTTAGGVSSVVVSSDNKRAYIGMTQYVAELDLTPTLGKRKIRYLVPSQEFLNKLEPEVENSIRRDFSDHPN